MSDNYEELVKRLKIQCYGCKLWDGEKCCLKGDCSAHTRLEAADAIEELNKDLERSKEWEKFWEKEANEALKKFQTTVAKILRWIPVTERLPLLNTPVLATDGIEVDISWMYGVPPRWITSYTAIDEDKLTHWMPLPKTPKEET